MFQVGQTVYHKSGSHFGKVVEVDEGIVYLEQRNGVEVDFPLKDVQATDPRIVAKEEIVDKNTFTKEDFSEENQAVFDAIPENIKKTTEILYNRIPFRSGEWKDLHDAQKMNLILLLCGTSYESIKTYHEKNVLEIGLLSGLGRSFSR